LTVLVVLNPFISTTTFHYSSALVYNYFKKLPLH